MDDTPGTKAARIARARTDRRFFRETYLSHYFFAAPAKFHLELDGLADSELLAAAAPREHAKSTLMTIGEPMYDIALDREHFIIVGSDTQTQAQAFTAAIKDELESNEKLRSDFPAVCGAVRGGESDFITGNDIRVMARGAGQKIRGLHHKQWRPTLMIWDDLENDEAVESPDQRAKLRRWWFKAVLNARGKGGRIWIIGTILHPDSLLNELLDPELNPLWVKRRWQALQEDGTPIWPEVWPLERLEAKKQEIGSVFFAAEYQNEPVDEETALFKEEWFRYWDDAELAGVAVAHYGACDPSLGKTDRSDFSAIIDVAVRPEGGPIYVDEADIRRRKPQDIVTDCLEHGRRHEYIAFGFEAVGFQAVLQSNLEEASQEQGVYLPIIEIQHDVPKDLRIRRLSPLVEHGVIRFRKTQTVLINQLRNYRPNGKQHDDGPDGLEMVVRLVRGDLSGGPRIRMIRPALALGGLTHTVEGGM
jgi:predicted phage terminase large subunit-like protein